MSTQTDAPAASTPGDVTEMTYREAVNAALHDEMTSDGSVVFSVQLNMPTPVYEVKRRFWFDEHIEGRSHLNHRVEFRLKAKQDESFEVSYRFDNMDTNGKLSIWRSGASTIDAEGNAVALSTVVNPLTNAPVA